MRAVGTPPPTAARYRSLDMFPAPPILESPQNPCILPALVRNHSAVRFAAQIQLPTAPVPESEQGTLHEPSIHGSFFIMMMISVSICISILTSDSAYRLAPALLDDASLTRLHEFRQILHMLAARPAGQHVADLLQRLRRILLPVGQQSHRRPQLAKLFRRKPAPL
jgi:hypothetical protein